MNNNMVEFDSIVIHTIVGYGDLLCSIRLLAWMMAEYILDTNIILCDAIPNIYNSYNKSAVPQEFSRGGCCQ